jgi:hypothetical protein
MKAVPIIEQSRPDPPSEWLRAVGRLAKTLCDERPELELPDQFRDLAVCQLDDAPALLIDDLSEISRFDHTQDARFYQDRARLRAGDADLVATCGDAVPGHEAYCRDYLGLGSPDWLRPKPPRLPLRIAEACWEDVVTRKKLIEKLQRDELRYVHPHMGTFSVWELAFLLHCETKRPLGVIAPPPEVTRWVNDKAAFTNTVIRLFGPEFAPQTECASNLAYIAKRVNDLAGQFEVIGLKLPNSAGGDGNLVMNSEQFRGQPLQAIRQTLKESLRKLAWDGASQVLIDHWETEVVCSPSAQLWVPPQPGESPVVEGIFVQTVEGTEGSFVGSAPARFPHTLHQEIVDRCWLLACLFQALGYVGRCSFDMILVGESLSNCRIEFVECNGRWGGTSLPMTLMNRIFGNWRQHPYAVHVVHHVDGLDQVSFSQVLAWFKDELFDVRTGRGSLIFVNPGRLKYQAGITVLSLSDSWEGAARCAEDMPQRLRQFAQECTDRLTDQQPMYE